MNKKDWITYLWPYWLFQISSCACSWLHTYSIFTGKFPGALPRAYLSCVVVSLNPIWMWCLLCHLIYLMFGGEWGFDIADCANAKCEIFITNLDLLLFILSRSRSWIEFQCRVERALNCLERSWNGQNTLYSRQQSLSQMSRLSKITSRCNLYVLEPQTLYRPSIHV